MEIIIITGMSGAGKTAALNLCQDNEYYTLDNLPPKLIKDVVGLLETSKMEISKLALVIDVRGGEFFKDLISEIENLKSLGANLKVLFIDASDEVLLKRYKELRRPHPISKSITLEKAIKLERENLKEIRGISDYIIDTSIYNLQSLKVNLEDTIGIQKKPLINIVSFGFKNGILKEADFVFDVRFTENPFYIPSLKNKNGKDNEVAKYVLEKDEVQNFIFKSSDLIKDIMPSFEAQGKKSIVLGIGCTGGKHRSVAIAEELGKKLSGKIKVEIYHRDSNMW